MTPFTIPKNIFLTAAISLFVITVSGIYAYINLALWLFLSDPLPENLDYICTFAGSTDREPYTLELLKSYKDAIWVVNTERSQLKKWASRKGIDSSRIVITPDCSSTLEEIDCFRDIIIRMEKESPEKRAKQKSKPLIGFVSSPYHMRRISVLFACRRKGSFSKGLFLPVPMERTPFTRAKLQSWWKDRHIRIVVKEEMVKMAGNIILTTPFLGAGIKKRVHDRKGSRF